MLIDSHMMPASPELAEGLCRLQETFAPDDLHPDLLPHISSPNEHGAMLSHPLVIFPFYVKEFNRTINLEYLRKVELLCNATSGRDYRLIVDLHERPYRMSALADVWDDIGSDTLKARLFISVWTDSENLWQTRELWLDMIDSLATEHFYRASSAKDREVLDRLNAPIRVYRGGDPAYEQGLSWTLSKAKAEWFATRSSRFTDSNGVTFSGVVEPDDILFYYSGRSEDEIVLTSDAVSRLVG